MENKKIFHYEEIDSTNTQASRLAHEGAEHGTVILAESQTAGKGRRGRSWESPKGENIYMSVLLRPTFQAEKAPMLTLIMAYGVTKTLQKYGFSDVCIKWPNDVVLSEKKVCGILTEMSMKDNQIDYVVIGVGVNVNNHSFPIELCGKATSLRLEGGKVIDKEMLCVDILNYFKNLYERFETTQDLSFIREEYNQLLVNCQKEVLVLEPGNEYVAYAHGINDKGELLVRTEAGEEKTVFAGEVSVRGIYGYV